MSADQRLASLMRALSGAGIEALVMGGHAVRYYGIDRNTIDFDVVASVATTDELRSRLRAAGLSCAVGAASISPTRAVEPNAHPTGVSLASAARSQKVR